MTTIKTEKVNLLFEKIKTIGFWSRLFSWNIVKATGLEACNEYKNLLNEQENLFKLAAKSETLTKEIGEKKVEIESLKFRLQDKEIEIGRLNEANHNLQEKVQKLNTEIATLNGVIEINQKNLEQKQNQLGQLEEARKQLNLNIQELKETISVRQGELNTFNKQILAKESEIGKFISQNDNSSEKIIDLQKDLEAYKAKQVVSFEEISKFKGELVRYEEIVEQKRLDILELEKKISTKQEINNTLQKQIQTHQNELGKLAETVEQNSKKMMELNATIASQNQALKHHQEDIQERVKEIAQLNEAKNQSQNRLKEIEIEKAVLKQDLDYVSGESEKLKRSLAGWEENDYQRVAEYQSRVNTLQTVIEQLEKDKQRLQYERENERLEKQEKMKRAWKTHEDNVQRIITEICQRHNVIYMDREKLSFKGKPDNTIFIAGEHIVFDAKCPMTEDLENFPKYIQSQAEALRKYAKEDTIKRDMFLVVPSNTISTDEHDKKCLKTFYHQMADYRVFVVAIDSLEPVILNLKKVEEYEFAEQLSPEDRENICSIIGKFIHINKRKIQLDCFLNQKLLEIIKQCDYLPEDIQQRVSSIEKSDKLNPPTDKRGKSISQKEIEKDLRLIGNIAELENVNFRPELIHNIEQIPLYK